MSEEISTVQGAAAPAPTGTPAARPVLAVTPGWFNYTAQTDDGLRISGALEAADGAAALQILESMRLRVIDLAPAKESGKAKPIRDSEFLAFNQQLAELAGAGMPIETGVRLAATSVTHGRMAKVLATIAAEIKAGGSVADVFEKHRRQLPPLYDRLISAGIAGNNLHGLLLTFGPRLQGQHRLGQAIWRAAGYPVAALCLLLLVLSLIGWQIMPRMAAAFADMHLTLPLITEAVFRLGHWSPYAAAGAVGLCAAIGLVWLILRYFGAQGLLTDRLFLSLPFVGPALRLGLIARWLAALQIGVAAGLDLPEAIRAAGQGLCSTALRRDGELWIAALANPALAPRYALLPETVAATVAFSAGACPLPDALQTLSDLYERLARLRAERIGAILTPALTILVALLVGATVFGLMTPLVVYIQDIFRWIGL